MSTQREFDDWWEATGFNRQYSNRDKPYYQVAKHAWHAGRNSVLDPHGLSTKQAMAVAVLEGDDVAFRALIDKLIEEKLIDQEYKVEINVKGLPRPGDRWRTRNGQLVKISSVTWYQKVDGNTSKCPNVSFYNCDEHGVALSCRYHQMRLARFLKYAHCVEGTEFGKR